MSLPSLIRWKSGSARNVSGNPIRRGLSLISPIPCPIWSYLGAKGTIYKGIDVLFDAVWLGGYLGVKNIDDVLSTYLSLQVENVHTEPLDSEYRRLMQEIVEVDDNSPMRLAIIQNRIMLLIERFFMRIYERKKNSFFDVPLSKTDIDRMMQVELLSPAIFSSPPLRSTSCPGWYRSASRS